MTTGNPLVTHPLIDKVSFTGSYLTGSRIMGTSSEGTKSVTLELGGKSSLICFEDADLNSAIDWILCSIFWNSGQICSATSRLLVHSSIKDKVLQRLVEETKKIQVGDGMKEGTKMGPIVSKNQYEKVKRYIQSGIKEGAVLLTGGIPDPSEFPEGGYFIRPTIFDNVNQSMTIWREEIFGPVLMIQTFDTEEEAIHMANDSEYGLAGAVFSTNEERCNRVVKKLKVGITWINCAQPQDIRLPVNSKNLYLNEIYLKCFFFFLISFVNTFK